MITCFHCGETSDTCVADVDGNLQCEACFSQALYLKHLDDKARRERVEAEYAAQDARSERDGGYKVQPINLKVRQAE